MKAKTILANTVLNKKFLMVALLLLIVSIGAYAQGEAGITAAAASIKKYVTPLTTLMYSIGGVCGIIGGIRIYNKWNAGDQDINKELMSWGGAFVFLMVVPTIVTAFFG